MRRFWLVATYEYTRHVFRKRFLLGVFGLPILIACLSVVFVLILFLSVNRRPVGIVDEVAWGSHANDLAKVLSEQNNRIFRFILYPDQLSARNALLNKDIQAYFVIHPDYPEDSKVSLFSLENTDSLVRSEFEEIMRFTLLSSQKPEIVHRIMEGSQITVISIDRDRQMTKNHWWKIIIPLFTGGVFIFSINMSSGYLLQAIVEEKENRTIEILLTSVSPTQLMAGKMAGNLSVGLTIILLYLIAAVGVIGFALIFILPEILRLIDWKWLAAIALLIMPALVLVGSWMTLIGSTVADEREASQISGFISIFLTLPFWFLFTLLYHPNSIIAIILSLFPLTSPVAFPIRAAFTTIPLWQWFSAYIFMYGCTALSIWLAGKAFRLGMLRYGKRTSLTELFRKKRSSHEENPSHL